MTQCILLKVDKLSDEYQEVLVSKTSNNTSPKYSEISVVKRTFDNKTYHNLYVLQSDQIYRCSIGNTDNIDRDYVLIPELAMASVSLLYYDSDFAYIKNCSHNITYIEQGAVIIEKR